LVGRGAGSAGPRWRAPARRWPGGGSRMRRPAAPARRTGPGGQRPRRRGRPRSVHSPPSSGRATSTVQTAGTRCSLPIIDRLQDQARKRSRRTTATSSPSAIIRCSSSTKRATVEGHAPREGPRGIVLHQVRVEPREALIVPLLRQHVRFEPVEGRGERDADLRPLARGQHPKRGILGQPFGVVGVLVPGQAAVDRLEEEVGPGGTGDCVRCGDQ